MNDQIPWLEVPGARSASVGNDQRRSRQTLGTDFVGAWVNDPRYYERREDGVLRLRYVWWLEVEGFVRNVPAGPWEPTLLVKCPYPSFVARWSVSLITNGVEGMTVSFDNPQGRHILAPHRNEWVRLSFGVLDVPTACDVKFRIFGQNAGSVSNIEFGELRLLSRHLTWEKEKLLLLCYQNMANHHNSTNDLQALPDGVLRLIGSYLIPPSDSEES